MRPTSNRPRAGAWGSDFRRRHPNQSPERKRRAKPTVAKPMKRGRSTRRSAAAEHDLPGGARNAKMPARKLLMAPSSSGLGYQVLILKTGVRVPVGSVRPEHVGVRSATCFFLVKSVSNALAKVGKPIRQYNGGVGHSKRDPESNRVCLQRQPPGCDERKLDWRTCWQRPIVLGCKAK